MQICKFKPQSHIVESEWHFRLRILGGIGSSPTLAHAIAYRVHIRVLSLFRLINLSESVKHRILLARLEPRSHSLVVRATGNRVGSSLGGSNPSLGATFTLISGATGEI